MKATLLGSALAALMLLGAVWAATAVGSAPNGQGAFVDDNGSAHEADINALAASGITRGCNPPQDDRFCPTRPVIRQEMATFLTRGLDLPRSSESPFTDTAGSAHAAAIDSLAAAGVTLGCNPPANDRFCPQAAVTREQMASFLVRGLDVPPSDNSPFVDTAGSVHAADIDALAAAGITRGCNPPANDRFCPGQAVTRQEMASFLVRALGMSEVLNRLSLRSGLVCTKDSTSCTGRATLAPGTRLEVIEGWYQVLPYQGSEEAQFTASDTNVAFTWNGTELTRQPRGVLTSGEQATRTWSVRPPALTRGTHTLRATWRWTGNVTQTVTYLLTVP